MDTRPIGMFDSGYGGVGVLAEAIKALPEEDFIFYGDNRNAPYGDRTLPEVRGFVQSAVDHLTAQRCKAIVIACNTATAAAAAMLRSELSLPVIGMEPALKPASLLPREGAVLVMATAMTLQLDKFKRLMALYGQNAIPVPCPGLVEYVERGETAGAGVEGCLRHLLSPYLDRPLKAVVLGCTHYVFLRGALSRVLPQGVALVDGNAGTVQQLSRRLQAEGLARGEPGHKGALIFLSSRADAATLAQMERMLQLAQQD